MKGSQQLITISLRDFALPVPRCGSLEPHSGYGRSAADGQEIHLRVQRRRAKADPSYQAEVPVSILLERGGYRFKIDGRMDGIFRTDTPRIEEIKSSSNLGELSRRLRTAPFEHPYCLQLMTYGYIHWREQQVLPRLCFHLVSSRTGHSEELELDLELVRYESWLELRLDELAREAAAAERRAARRRKLAAALLFPFATPRQGQSELMQEIVLGMAEMRPMLIQAPTGMGKTVGVLYPVLKEALARGQKVVYLTPKNSLHAVAEDAVARLQETGAPVKSLSITAKGKICFMNEPLCNPQYCPYARDYYAKVARHGVVELLAKKRKLKTRSFREAAEKFQVCPFELQLDCIEQADVVICDYNYVFAPRSASARLAGIGVDQSGKPNLVIDEAHNLPARAMEHYSPALSSLKLEAMREELRRVHPLFQREAEELLRGCLQVVADCRNPNSSRPSRIDPPVQQFLEQDARLRLFLSRYLESQFDPEPNDPVLRLCFYWSAFSEALEFLKDPQREEFFTTFHPHTSGGVVKITCCDASAMLKQCYLDYAQVVCFSATLKPFDYYGKLSGFDLARVRRAEFLSPFPKELRKLLIIPQVSTRYAQRERNYAKIAGAISRIVALRRGNYSVFFPSFDFLERVAALFQAPDGFSTLKQERSMKGSQVEAVLAQLRLPGLASVVFAVQGGSFSEGMDYAGEMLVGAFVVGPPLPSYDLEREQMREYYQRQYRAGFDYAYTIPAMAKAIQSAGRVIRSESDRGIIVLMDDRFLQPGYSASMPGDWFEAEATELVSSSILREITEFWGEAPPA